MRFPTLPLPEVRPQVASWLGSLPLPACFAITSGETGLGVRLCLPAGTGHRAIAAWSTLSREQSSWEPSRPFQSPQHKLHRLHTRALLPTLPATSTDGILTLGAALENLRPAGTPEITLFIRLLAPLPDLHARLQALFAYATGTEKGVDDDTPNPWSLRLAGLRAVMAAGALLTVGAGAAAAPGWLPPAISAMGVGAGVLLAAAGYHGTLTWLAWRSLPSSVVEPRLQLPLFRCAFLLDAPHPGALRPFASGESWSVSSGIHLLSGSTTFPLSGFDIAALIAPPESSTSAGMATAKTVQEVASPQPTTPLQRAPLELGISPITGVRVGIDPSGHLLAVGGSRAGKSSAVFRLLTHIANRPSNPPGLFLVDPHTSLADAFLDHIDRLPPVSRALAVRRLRVITPELETLVPLNPLTLPDFEWAGNALVQAGKRIWADFWGPRMQAVFLGLARLAHAWNSAYPEAGLGLLHATFAAFNPAWRQEAVAHLPPAVRGGSDALEALLGQAGSQDPRDHRWVTELVSPILSKLMALELSPWLFASLHQPSFIDLESWLRERAWIVLRLPTGALGREGAALTAAILYNLFEAAFRRITARQPLPYHIVIDEAQEIGAGMQLESLLAEGGKFGARVTVLAQSLALLRSLDGFEALVQSVLANTSSQLFFSPDPEDAPLIRETLSLDARYGPTTIDIPSLQAWLRARIAGRWQPPALVQVEPLPRADPARVQRVIQEVIASHPEDFVRKDGWEAHMNASLEWVKRTATRNDLQDVRTDDARRLGF